MKLSQLIKTLQPRTVSGMDTGGDPQVASLHYRAQQTAPGGVFVAIRGFAADGHDYIDQAVEQGAIAVVTDRPVQTGAIVIEVKNTRVALAQLAAEFYGHPSGQMTVIGITGTNGKTTTAYLVEAILQTAGYKTGLIGTINYHFDGRSCDNPVTTPESLDLQAILAQMRAAGVTHVVMEASSHAIDLYRIQHCWFDVGVFTNLSRDHLDFHGDLESYWASKKKLFTDYLATGPKKNRARAVINCFNERGRLLPHSLEGTQRKAPVTIGERTDDAIRLLHATQSLDGIHALADAPNGKIELKSPLVGNYNLENILCAVGVGIALELPAPVIAGGIGAAGAVPGRLEAIRNDHKRYVYVDYAHTPDALENVLQTLRNLPHNRLICVFGCGGDRDSAKRPQMGAIAGRRADLAVVTSDNPRSEPPDAIIAQVVDGTRKEMIREFPADTMPDDWTPAGYTIEPDRRKAIELAIRVSQTDDVILIAGKGHETYQLVGDKTLAFDDRQVAREALAQLKVGT